jgi:hypothetical protein
VRLVNGRQDRLVWLAPCLMGQNLFCKIFPLQRISRVPWRLYHHGLQVCPRLSSQPPLQHSRLLLFAQSASEMDIPQSQKPKGCYSIPSSLRFRCSLLKKVTHLLHPTNIHLLQISHPSALPRLPPLLLLLHPPLLLCSTLRPFILVI